MRNIEIKGQRGAYFIPTVNFDEETGVCDLSGESFLEDTLAFYTPLINWLNEYIKTKRPINFNIRLTYFNTSSSRSILEILKILKNYENNKGNVTVKWYFDKTDIDMIEEIEDYQLESELDIKMIPV